ncbi:MAG TPA: NAD(P)H-dependent glycerol-3-phosphate dehydrogenase [Phycisphaerales bacterium]|nr:NAD(P)H-dependent glycerol-3-phosphate dehydrogenase [Phycisphaerales bacterium]
MPRTDITILGDGQMGLVCAAILSGQPGAGRISLWSHDARDAERLQQTRKSSRLPMIRLADRVEVTGDAATALMGAELIVSAVPTQFIRRVWGSMTPLIDRAAEPSIVSVAKGIEVGTLMTPTAIVRDVVTGLKSVPPAAQRLTDPARHCVLSGPTIAPELARFLPATMIAASTSEELAKRVQALFTTSSLRVYTATDPIGVEVAGATKNVIAIAAGILDGLQAGHNAKSALLARGLAEIARLGAALGARQETFFGLAGVGDLATTCFSPEGRNRSLGEALGKGELLASYLNRTDSVVEGVETTKGVVELARRLNVEMPITAAVHAVLYERVDPIDAIARLMSRPPKPERVG